MDSSQLKKIKQVYHLLCKEFGYPEHNCPDYEKDCYQCRIKRFLEDFGCYIDEMEHSDNFEATFSKIKKQRQSIGLSNLLEKTNGHKIKSFKVQEGIDQIFHLITDKLDLKFGANDLGCWVEEVKKNIKAR